MNLCGTETTPRATSDQHHEASRALGQLIAYGRSNKVVPLSKGEELLF